MYAPALFAIDDPDVLAQVIAHHPLGLLIAATDDFVSADPIPFMGVQTDEGLVLHAHVARPNPVWQALQKDPRVLVVFQGEDHYVTPNWYPSKQDHGRVVPTWNYVMVQAHGTATVHDDPTWLRAQVSHLTNVQEATQPKPWAVSDMPPAFTDAQLRAIVGLEIKVRTLQGKFKLSQNRTEADRAGVIAGLEALPTGQTMAARMQHKDVSRG